MKSLIYLFSFVLLTAMTSKNERTSGDPVSGVSIKISCKPAICTELSGVTDAKGNVEFKGVTIGKYKLLEIRNQRIAGSEPISFDPMVLEFPATGTVNTATNRAKLGPVHQEISAKKNGVAITITVTTQDDWVKVNISKAK